MSFQEDVSEIRFAITCIPLPQKRWFPDALKALDRIERAGAGAVPPLPGSVPSALFQGAGPHAVALRVRFADVVRAQQALGDYFSERTEVGNDPDLAKAAEGAEAALSGLKDAISDKLRKLVGFDR